MTFYVDGTTGLTFNDSSSQNTSAIVTGKVPYTNLPVGSVIQVVTTINGTEQYTTSGSDVATSISASITPRFSSSKILIIASVSPYIAGDTSTQGGWSVYRNSTTQIANFNDACQVSATTTRFAMPVTTLTYLDSPATTSSTNYKIYMFRRGGTGTIGVNSYGSTAPSSGFTLMEIAQ